VRWQLELVSGPEIEPVTLAEMRRHLRMFEDVTDEDADITALITGAREWVEDYTGRILMDQTWRLSIDQTGDLWLDPAATSVIVSDDPDSPGFYLRRSPILAIVSVNTVDADGAETLVDTADYELRAADSKFPFLVPTSTATWRDANLRIEFRAGFADLTGSPQDDAGVVPERFKQAMKLWVEAHYDRDEKMMQQLLDAAENIAKRLKGQVGFA